VELRLLTDASYGDKLDVMVDVLIDQYVENVLPAEDRDRAEDYFFESAERRDKLKFALALKKRKAELDSNKRWRQKALTFYLPIAASVLITIGLGAIVWRAFFYQSDLNKGLVALQIAFHEQRPNEARISGFNYAPEQRGGAAKIDYVQRDRAASLLLNAVVNDPSTAAHHALGKYYLAERQLDKAIDQFEAALKLDPQGAQTHSDLGAALLEAGKIHSSQPEQGKGIEEFASSLEHLNKALELDGSLLEALFNRALLYQYMMLPRQAEDDWRRYLEKDSSSKWADEARQRLKMLEQQNNKSLLNDERSRQKFFSTYEQRDDAGAWEIISRSYLTPGNTIASDLLDSYLDLEARGESVAASSKLQALSYVGQLESQRSGDHYTSDLADFYSRTNSAQRRALSRAREQVRKGYDLFIRSKGNDALSHYALAKQTFDEAGDECESDFVSYRIGHCYLFQSDFKKSDEIFRQLLQTFERKSYKWLLSQSLQRIAGIRLNFNEYSESIGYVHQALKLSEQIQDTNGILNNLIMLADEYESLNNQRQSLSFLQRGLILTQDSSVPPPHTWALFTGLALNLGSLGFHHAALEYQKEALQLALEMNRPLYISRSYDYLGLTYGSLKIYDEALRNINLAFEAGSGLSGQSIGLEMMANSSLHAGEIYRQSGVQDKGIEAYDRSIQLYNKLGSPYFAYPAHKGKLLSYIAKGDDRSIEEELQTVLGLFEQYRSKLTGESQRNTFFDVEQSIYDLAIDFAMSRKHDSQRAFEYSELSRGRSLYDAMRQGAQVSALADGPDLRLPSVSTPMTLLDIQQRMPEQAQIIQYAVLDDRLLIWVITRTGVSTEEVGIGSVALSDMVRDYLQLINRPAPGMNAQSEQAAKNLHDILVRPVEQFLDKAKLACIVPDKILHYLPFNALISAATGKFLVEDFSLEFSPSSTIFVDCTEQAGRRAGTIEERLLSVGDPSFDRSAFPSLLPLYSASREAAAITAYYKSSHLLLGDNAREGAVTTEIVNSHIAHFALHYVTDLRSSMLSKLLLASEHHLTSRGEEPDGVWQAHEIYRMRLPQTRLVVLSACQTGIEQQYRGEGAISIARPFIAIGVPLVIASLWPVDSDSTERLMVSFHRHRTRDRFQTAEALRRAQLEMLRDEDPRYRQPYYWAAFTAIGGYTEY
jgi:CHAT domain-containing protein/tetratricopeptide (TPR) repeat protein